MVDKGFSISSIKRDPHPL